MKNTYGGYLKTNDGGLENKTVSSQMEARLRKDAADLEKVKGFKLENLTIFKRAHVPTYKPSRKSLEEAGIPEDEIVDILVDAETHEWPVYHDEMGWRGEGD